MSCIALHLNRNLMQFQTIYISMFMCNLNMYAIVVVAVVVVIGFYTFLLYRFSIRCIFPLPILFTIIFFCIRSCACVLAASFFSLVCRFVHLRVLCVQRYALVYQISFPCTLLLILCELQRVHITVVMVYNIVRLYACCVHVHFTNITRILHTRRHKAYVYQLLRSTLHTQTQCSPQPCYRIRAIRIYILSA